jgi:phosphonoacetate hydrolase
MSEQRIIIAMLDGLDMAYLERIPTPNFSRLMKDGFFKEVSGVFPSVTNVNNVSIACGAWPDEHGISANSYYDKASGKPQYMNAAELIKSPTVFAKASRKGVKSALLTCKKKTLELFHKDVEIGIAAEAPSDDDIARYGRPADIYSREINYWLWETAVAILEDRPDIGLLYVHITDYPMHAWGPDDPESREHMEELDRLLGRALAAAPDAAFLATADHGMNYKTRCWDLMRVLSQEGIAPRFVLSPERDYYVVHHRNFTGCSWIWLNQAEDEAAAREILGRLAGVEEILTRTEAAERFHLNPEHIGDLIVTGDRDTMFGEMESAHENLPPTYRAHGSLYEMRLPLFIWNLQNQRYRPDSIQYNLDLTKRLYL